MCGITGFLARGGMDAAEMAGVVGRMSDALHHRGPDSGGTWVEPSAGVALGHRRLAIVDLSPEGSQPMASSCGRYMLVFNGEIYNHLDIREALLKKGARFKGRSDTEVMVESFREYGIEKTLGMLAGMFSFAVFDRREGELVLARDRMGEKPLYYGNMGGSFLFGSELKALRRFPGAEWSVDREALVLFMRHNYVPSPHSIYKGIRKLPPGCLLRVPLSSRGAPFPQPAAYWSLADAAAKAKANPFAGDDEEASRLFEESLGSSIGEMMVADVPLGAFLSGGIDSSLVVALMQARSTRPVKTFTIGFSEKGFDEAGDSVEVARHLGTDHTELYVTPRDALDIIPRLPDIYDEPFSDSSQIPTCLLSALTRRHVTVSLSGDGGDELMGGYTRYLWNGRVSALCGMIPSPLRKGMAGSILALPDSFWEAANGAILRLLPRRMRLTHPGDKLLKLADLLKVDSPEDAYLDLVSNWKAPERLVLGGREPPTLVTDRGRWPDMPSIERMMYLDAMTYLPDDIMVKVDRASMAASLEARAPFLDHRLAEFTWRLPLRMKLRDGKGKWLMRKILERHVPAALWDRPKKGFGVPVGQWLKGPLRDWAESLLDEGRLRREGFLAPAFVGRAWRAHLTGRRNSTYLVWSVLMFQAWLERHGSAIGEAGPVPSGESVTMESAGSR